MNLYAGTKTVTAKPMTLGEYSTLRGWELPKDEHPHDEGYLLVDNSATVSNHPDFDGHISWTPKALFEASFREIGKELGKDEIALKLIQEFNEVNDRAEPLRLFLKKPRPAFISEKEWLILHDQLDAQADYRDCLLMRIAIHTIGIDPQPTPNDPDHKPVGLGSLGEDE